MAESTLTPEQTQALLTSLLDSGKTPPAKLADLELVKDLEGNPIAYRDPNTGNTITIPRPTAAARTPTPTAQLDRIDAKGNVIPPTDTTTVAAKLRDPALGTSIDLPDAKTAPDGTLKEFGNQLLNVKPDGTYSVIASKPADATTQQAKSTFDGPDGARYEYDPNAESGKRLTQLIAAPPDKTKPATEVRNGVTYQYDPSTKAWSEATGLPAEKKPVAVSTNTQARELVGLDEQGNVISREPNPNYVQPQPTQLQADLTAPNIPLLKPDGTVQWVPNENRVPAGQAMQDLLGQVGVQVNANQLSMADAKDMLTGAVNTMNAQSSRTNAQTAQIQAQTAQQTQIGTAAGDILRNTQAGAQTGAGLINQRVQAASSMLNNTLGLAAGAKNLMSAPAGLGEALTQGIAGWTADLAGGQGTLDSAARMVQQADPRSNMADPSTQHAIGVLSQMLDKYQDLTGAPHPAVSATQAATQSAQTGGMTAPGGYNPQDIQWNQPPQNAPGRTNVGLGMGTTTPGFTAPAGGYAAQQPGTYGPLTGAMPAVGAVPSVAPVGAVGAYGPFSGAMPGFTAPRQPITIQVG